MITSEFNDLIARHCFRLSPAGCRRRTVVAKSLQQEERVGGGGRGAERANAVAVLSAAEKDLSAVHSASTDYSSYVRVFVVWLQGRSLPRGICWKIGVVLITNGPKSASVNLKGLVYILALVGKENTTVVNDSAADRSADPSSTNRSTRWTSSGTGFLRRD